MSRIPTQAQLEALAAHNRRGKKTERWYTVNVSVETYHAIQRVIKGTSLSMGDAVAVSIKSMQSMKNKITEVMK